MYIISDLKKLFTNKITCLFFIIIGFTFIFSPLYVWVVNFSESSDPQNGYLGWILADRAGWGLHFYNTLFFIFPVLSTGLFFYTEKETSMMQLLVCRKSKWRYFLSKISCSFLFPFILFLSLFFANILVSYAFFPADGHFPEYFIYQIPKTGSFAYALFSLNPIIHVIFFALINSLTIGLFSLFVTLLQMIYNFRNKFSALIIPTIFLYLISFIFDHIPILIKYNLHIIIQPAAHWAMSIIYSWSNLMISITIWITIDVILIFLALIQNKDVF